MKIYLAARFSRRHEVKATCLILLGETPRNNSRGGHLVEFGVALALGLRVMVVGPRATVFHCLPAVEVFDTWQSLLKEVQK